MKIYRVSFIGHRQIIGQPHLQDRLEATVRDLLRNNEYVEFYMGRNGDFDLLAASAVKAAQKALDYKNSTLALVLPYSVKDVEYHEKYYDEICLPLDPKIHPKSAITKRNQWLVDNSDLLIAYVEPDRNGGAQATLNYAKKQGVKIVNLFSE